LASASAASSFDTKTERRGPVLDVLHGLLDERRDEEVVVLVRKLLARNSALEEKLAALLMRRCSNEGVSADQLRLLFEQLDAVPDGDEQIAQANDKLRGVSNIDGETVERERKKSQPPLRRPIPKNLRRVDNPIGVAADERPCPKCKGERKCIGHDVTEVIELVPAEIIVRVDRREKLACLVCEGEIARAPVGDKVVAGGRMGSRLVAELLVDKYRDGLPLHRQKERLERLGIPLPVSTLADQVTWGSELLQPLHRAAIDIVLESTVMQLDATGLAVLARKQPGGRKLGSLWGYIGDATTAAVLYTSTGKKLGQRPGEIGPEEMLARRSGYVVADAAGIFDASFLRNDLIECGCNMHARRYFHKALEAGDKRAALTLAAFKKLYAIEESIAGLDADSKCEQRRLQSRPVYDELVAWCEVYRPHEPPASALGKAIGYLLRNATALRRFLEDGRIPIDNGAVERLHVRTAITRKNYLFAGSDAGGERAAIVYTILGCCQLCGINPVEYLAEVLPKLARDGRPQNVREMLPARRAAG
jgi:transposase